MRTQNLIPMLLTLFDGEASGDGSNTAPATQNTADNNAAPATQNASEKDGNTTEDYDKEFKSLIKGKYKGAYEKAIQSAMAERFKSSKDMEQRLNSMTPLLEMLGQKYGADSDDPQAILAALEEDNSFFEQEAMERGLDVETLKQIKQLERENDAYKRVIAEQDRKHAAEQQYQSWLEESEAVKEMYGDAFDLDSELQNPAFTALLGAPGMTLQKAFEAAHLNELVGGAMQFASRSTSKAIADDIRARGNVAKENAASAAPAAKTSVDINSLTREQMEKINQHIMAGEKVTPQDIPKILGGK